MTLLDWKGSTAPLPEIRPAAGPRQDPTTAHESLPKQNGSVSHLRLHDRRSGKTAHPDTQAPTWP
jgi:hypothetical protein